MPLRGEIGNRRGRPPPRTKQSALPSVPARYRANIQQQPPQSPSRFPNSVVPMSPTTVPVHLRLLRHYVVKTSGITKTADCHKTLLLERPTQANRVLTLSAFAEMFGLLTMHRYPPRLHRNKNAFSLIEVTIALGIVAFAMVPLMALLPMGAQTQKQSIEESIVAQIQQKIVGDLQRAEFSKLLESAASGPEIYYFDEQGTEVESDTTGVGAGNRLYDVEVTLIHPVELAGESNYYMIQADIRIAANPAGDAFNPFSEANRDDTLRRFAIISKSTQ